MFSFYGVTLSLQFNYTATQRYLLFLKVEKLIRMPFLTSVYLEM